MFPLEIHNESIGIWHQYSVRKIKIKNHLHERCEFDKPIEKSKTTKFFRTLKNYLVSNAQVVRLSNLKNI